jgi:hypothetical protein
MCLRMPHGCQANRAAAVRACFGLAFFRGLGANFTHEVAQVAVDMLHLHKCRLLLVLEQPKRGVAQYRGDRPKGLGRAMYLLGYGARKRMLPFHLGSAYRRQGLQLQNHQIHVSGRRLRPTHQRRSEPNESHRLFRIVVAQSRKLRQNPK